MVLGGLALLAGCATRPSLSNRPGPSWPESVSRPRPPGAPAEPGSPAPGQPTDPPPEPGTGQSAVDAIARHRWTQHEARPGQVNAMGAIRQITVHHEGWKPVYFTSWGETVQRLRRIRQSHVNHHGWGDIGYHFVIDRAGRVWEARSLQYQGAHVKDHNPHNIGVMVLGNFQRQYPSEEQVQALGSFLEKLMQRYDIPRREVNTHRELGETACPGRYLQPEVTRFRRNGHV
jgi:hypothetical protein